MSELNAREQELVSLGAAIACNCVPCIGYHVPEAKRAGLIDRQIEQAVRIADKVRRVPARMVMEAARARIAESPSGSDETAESGCGCSVSSPGADSC